MAKQAAVKKALSPKQMAAQRVQNDAAAKKVAATRRTAQQKAKNREVTSAADWKKQGLKTETTLEVPSGNICRVKVVGLDSFFKNGLIPNNLLPLVSDAITTGKGLTKKETSALITDPEAIKSMVELTDRVVCDVVIEPHVEMPPATEDERDPNVLYVDEVDLQDKFFIFQFVVGGTRDMESFRQQQADAVEGLEDGQAVESTTE